MNPTITIHQKLQQQKLTHDRIKYVNASTFRTVQRCCADLHIIEHYERLQKASWKPFEHW